MGIGSRKPGRPPKQRNAGGLTQVEVANRSGCSQSTVSRLTARGVLSIRDDGRYPEDAPDTVRAYMAASEEKGEELSELERQLTEARRDKVRADARLREMEVELESGRFVERKEVERAVTDAMTVTLAVLRSVPQRTALELQCKCRDAAATDKAISVEVERAISEMKRVLQGLIVEAA
jgi:transcriptional regulator with XRE-family HTH domain